MTHPKPPVRGFHCHPKEICKGEFRDNDQFTNRIFFPIFAGFCVINGISMASSIFSPMGFHLKMSIELQLDPHEVENRNVDPL